MPAAVWLPMQIESQLVGLLSDGQSWHGDENLAIIESKETTVNG